MLTETRGAISRDHFMNYISMQARRVPLRAASCVSRLSVGAACR